MEKKSVGRKNIEERKKIILQKVNDYENGNYDKNREMFFLKEIVFGANEIREKTNIKLPDKLLVRFKELYDFESDIVKNRRINRIYR